MVDQPMRHIKFEIVVIRDIYLYISVCEEANMFQRQAAVPRGHNSVVSTEACRANNSKYYGIDTKVEGCVIAVASLHKVRKCVSFKISHKNHKRYSEVMLGRQDTKFLHERSGHALGNLSHRLTHSQNARRETAIAVLSVDSHHKTMTQEYVDKRQENRLGHADWVHRKHSR